MAGAIPLRKQLRFVGFLALAGAAWSLPAAADSAEEIPRAIVKVSSTHIHPDYMSPWQKKRPHSVTGSGSVIDGKRILTNAHVVLDHTLIEVQHVGDGRRYDAELVAMCDACDLAVLEVSDPRFFDDTDPLPLGDLPALRSEAEVYGFPVGGESMSVTSGIVSRIELGRYSHSNGYLLRAQIDAALNSGNSGGPVISDGKIVGIAMQTLQSADGIGYMVPTPIVRHFLRDLEDGSFDGFPDLGIYYQPLENEALRAELGLGVDDGGVLVIGVSQRGPAAGHLQPGDLLLGYDGYDIDRQGRVKLRGDLQVDCTHLEQRKQVGEKLTVRVRRGDREHLSKIPMATVPKLVPNRYEGGPPYYVYAGIVFQPLSHTYLRVFNRAPATLARYTEHFTAGPYTSLLQNEPDYERREIIVMSSILADEINRGYADSEDSIIQFADGERVRDLRHLIQLLERPGPLLVRLVTEGGALLVLDRGSANERGNRILTRYGLSLDRSSNLGAVPASPH